MITWSGQDFCCQKCCNLSTHTVLLLLLVHSKTCTVILLITVQNWGMRPLGGGWVSFYDAECFKTLKDKTNTIISLLIFSDISLSQGSQLLRGQKCTVGKQPGKLMGSYNLLMQLGGCYHSNSVCEKLNVWHVKRLKCLRLGSSVVNCHAKKSLCTKAASVPQTLKSPLIIVQSHGVKELRLTN